VGGNNPEMARTSWVGVEDRDVTTIRVDVLQRVVATVSVLIQCVRGVEKSLVSQVDSVRNHPPAQRRCIVPCPEVIQPALAVAFFAGELATTAKLYAR